MIRINRVFSVLLVCVFGILTFFAIRQITSTNAAPSDAASSPNGVDVILLPSSSVIAPSQPLDVDVLVFPNSNQVSAMELRINFDSTKLTPRSNHPFLIGPELTMVLPNCEYQEGDPCPATSAAHLNQAYVFLGVMCTEAGCTLPTDSGPFKVATLQLQATANATGTTELTLRDQQTPTDPTLVAAFQFDHDAMRLVSPATISFSTCTQPFDFIPDNTLNILDVMHVATLWNSGHGNALYNGSADFDADGDIDIIDVQTVANTWNTPCN